MAFPILSVPRFPNVPNVAGVPPVLRSAAQSFVAGFASSLENALGLGGLIDFNMRWGIFGDTVSIIGDNVTAVEMEKENRVSNYPVEKGGFESYNKVQMPRQCRVTFTKGGSESARATFLRQIDDACDSLTLFSVVTPEVTYASVTLTRSSYRREQRNGATLITVEVWAEEVRVTAQTQFSSTQEPAGASSQDGGTVQCVAPTAAQLASVTNAGLAGLVQ